MTIIDNTSADATADRAALTATVTGTGTASKQPSYEITPELRPHADAILAVDPNDVPTPHQMPEGWGASLTMRSTGLPPEMRQAVEARLSQLGDVTPEQRAAKDVEFTFDAIRSKRMELRVLTGVGSDASPYHREQVAIAREVRDLSKEFDRLSEQLTEVARYDTSVDPVTGDAKAVPVYAVSAERAKGIASQQDDISRRIRLLLNDDGTMGYEAEKRLRQRLHESATQRAALHEQVAGRAEAERRADEIIREERINKQAQSIASMRRNTF